MRQTIQSEKWVTKNRMLEVTGLESGQSDHVLSPVFEDAQHCTDFAGTTGPITKCSDDAFELVDSEFRFTC